MTAVHSIITINTKVKLNRIELHMKYCDWFTVRTGSQIKVEFSLINTVNQETYTGDLTEHSPVVKLYKIHAVQLLFYWQSQLDVGPIALFTSMCPHSA